MTRPPLNEEYRPIECSNTPLEKQVLATLRQLFLAFCSRQEVHLAPPLAASLGRQHPQYTRFSNVEFQPHGSAAYTNAWLQEHGNAAAQDCTVGFLLFTPRLLAWDKAKQEVTNQWQDGPGLLAVFGVSGPETLFWTHLIERRFAADFQDVVRSRVPRLWLVEWKMPSLPSAPSLKFFQQPTARPRLWIDAVGQLPDDPRWKISARKLR